MTEKVEKPKTQEEQFLEAMDMFKVLARFAGQVAANKKVGSEDIPALIELSGEFKTIIDGIEGIDKALPASITRRFSMLAFEGVLSIFDEFKNASEEKAELEEETEE